jgi:hypothetical protein
MEAGLPGDWGCQAAIAADYSRMIAGRIHDVCGVHFPGLIGLDLT